MVADKIARILRVITAPPVLITVTLILFWVLDLGVFDEAWQLVLAVCLLGVVPALAYPLQALIPALKKGGRDAQRKLAFVLSLVGYSVGWLVGCLGGSTSKMLLVYLVYFVSVVLLSVVNKCFSEKASGHACSAMGSLSFAVMYIGTAAVVPAAVVFAAMAWSSVRLGRHSMRNIATGVLVFLTALAAGCIVLMCVGVM